MALLKQSTAYTRTFKMISSGDHFSLKTSASPAVNLSKAGAAFAAAGGAVTEVANGWYKVALSTTDTNTLGDLSYYITGTGADDTDFVDQVSALIEADLATPTNITAATGVDVTKWLGTAASTPTVAGVPNVNAKTWNDLTTVALPLIPTTAGRTLDVSTTGEAGVDWANVGSPTTTNALTGTTIATTQKVDIETIKTNAVVNAGTITFPTTATLASTTNLTAGTIATVSGNVNGSVGSVTGAVGSVTGLTAATVHSDLDDIQARLPAALTANGNMKSSMVEILTTALTETAGLLAGGFKKFFNIAAPVSTMDVVARVTLTDTVTTYTGNTVQTGDSFARIGVAGAGLTNIDLPDQTMNVTGNITGNLSGSVGSVTGAVGSVTATVTTDVTQTTRAEPAQGTPAATATPATKIDFLYKAWRNKSDQTATLYNLYNDDAVTVDHKATVSDDGTTFVKGEVATGP